MVLLVKYHGEVDLVFGFLRLCFVDLNQYLPGLQLVLACIIAEVVAILHHLAVILIS